MKIKEEINMAYGEPVVVNSVTYVLEEQAEAGNYGTDGGIRYYATAHIADSGERSTHRIAWDTVPEYKYHVWHDDQCVVCKSGDTCFFSDESNVCDWDDPAGVEAI